MLVNNVYGRYASFFKSYELAFIAADERDVVKVRSTVRGEDVRLFRLDMQPQTVRGLLGEYVKLANDVSATPRWYHTLTANCTTTVWGLARSLKPDLPIDRRLILSGRLPDYLADLGVIEAADAIARDAAARITPLAQLDDGRKPFSDLIRHR